MKRRLTGMLLLAVMMLVMVIGGCGAKEKEEGKSLQNKEPEEQATSPVRENGENDLHIVYITPLLVDDVWMASKEGFDAASIDMNFVGDWIGPASIDVDAMIKEMENAIAQGVDGIITCGLNPQAMAEVLNQANIADIPVVLVNAGSETEAPYLAYIGTDASVLGAMAAEEAVKEIGEEAPQVIYMGSGGTEDSLSDVTVGYRQVFGIFGGYKELSLEEHMDDVQRSVDRWHNIFTTYPDVNICANISPEGAVGAVQVAKEQGIQDKITIISVGITDELLGLIREGELYGTVSQNYYRMGYQAAQWIVDYKTDGKEPEKKMNDAGALFINKDNVDTFSQTLRDKSTW